MGGCAGAAWNVISASGPLSQLAGVIAGFVFAGVIVLLSQPRPTTIASEQQIGSARLRALVPFFGTFVAMGLNAYVFGLLSGEEAADSCRRVWTAAAVASGMLAIGTVASVCGIFLLVRAYLAREHLSHTDTRQLDYLERLLTVTIRLLAVVAPALLLQRVYEFLRVWYHGDLHGLGWMWILVIAAACSALIVLLTVHPAVAKRPVEFFDGALFFAGFCTVLYSVAGTALVGFFLGVGPADWNSTPSFVPWTVAVLVLVLPAAAIGGYLYAIRGIVRFSDASSTRSIKEAPT